MIETDSWDSYEALVRCGLHQGNGTDTDLYDGPETLLADYHDEDGQPHRAVVATANYNIPTAVKAMALLAAAPAEILALRHEVLSLKAELAKKT